MPRHLGRHCWSHRALPLLRCRRPGGAEAEPPPGVGRWLLYGGPLRRIERVCRVGGQEGGSTSYLVYRGTDGWWRVPFGLLRVLHHRRSMQPVPVLYVAVAGVGTVLGLGTRRLLGRWWWAVPLAALSGTWLFFLSSALWGPPGRGSLLTDLLMVVSSRRGRARQRAEQEERYRRVPFPLFGLDASWEGPRIAEGMGSF